MDLSAAMIGFIRLRPLDDENQVVGVDAIVMAQYQSLICLAMLPIEIIHAIGIEAVELPLDPVHDTACLQQQFGRAGTI